MSALVDISGERFNFVTVIKRVENNEKGSAMWLCRCDCGKEKTYKGISLRNRPPLSCGCDLKKELSKAGGERENSGRKVSSLMDKMRYTPDVETGCWVWEGNKGRGGCGYGRVSYKGHYIGAHRASYIAHVGDIPEGMLVLHKCDNRPCVNPEHLFLGTQKDNIQDMLKKGRGRYQK